MTTDRDVKRAGVMQEVTKEALESAAIELRAFVRSDMLAKLESFTGGSVSWIDEPKFDEFEEVKSVAIYADDADWDDDENPPEPIGYEDVEYVMMRGSVYFTSTQ